MRLSATAAGSSPNDVDLRVTSEWPQDPRQSRGDVRLRIIAALVTCAPAVLADEPRQTQIEFGVGPVWSLTSLCRGYGCPSPVGISFRGAYEFAPLASIGIRGRAILGPEGIGTVCGTAGCDSYQGYRALSVLVDGQVHTIGVTQAVGTIAVGIGRLIRLQCNCSEQYDTHGTALPVLEIGLGFRTYVVPSTIHVGIEARYSAMFNAETGGTTCCGPTVERLSAHGGLTVSSVALSLTLGAAL
jgi:hypothetical protein